MRIVYLAHVNDSLGGGGVMQKIAAQIRAWRGHGHEVRALVATRDSDPAWADLLGDVVIGRYDGWASRFRTMDRLSRAATSFQPDIVYMRFDLFYPPMLWLARRAALVVEINTDDVAEYRLGSRKRGLYNARTRGRILGRARALVCVTGELARSPSFTGFSARREVIHNGIDLSKYPEQRAPVSEYPRLAFVGSLDQPWQGTDKVIALAAERPDWRFDIVGDGTLPAGVPDNVTWHGRLDRAGVLDVLATSDVGIGTLALHRKDMDEACALKVREYLAVGLPVISGCEDPDVDRIGDLVLRIPNRESNVTDGRDAIAAFVDHARGRRIPRVAVAHLDSARKEEQRLALFEDIATT